MHRDRSSIFLAGVACVVGINLWIIAPLPIALVGGGYDDFLFVRLANSIAAGHWLGSFDQLTLSKGPFFPIFLASTIVAGIPYRVAIQCLYLSGSYLLSVQGAECVTKRASAQQLICLLLFSALGLNPVTFDLAATQLLREDLYAALTLLLLGLAGRNFLNHPTYANSVMLGLILIAYWTTREEGILVAAPLSWLFVWWLSRTRDPKRYLAHFTATGLAAVGAISILCCVNYRVYGVFRTCDFQSGPFPVAYGALSRTNEASRQRYIAVSREARHRAYDVSPMARELRPFLDGDVGSYWTKVGCDAHPIQNCHDIQAGWFMWALREAVTRAGHYGSARDADKYYRELAKEINTACDHNTIACLPSRSGYMPPFSKDDIIPTLKSVARIVSDIARLNDPSLAVTPTLAQGAFAQAYSRITSGTTVSPPEAVESALDWELSGWLVGRADHLKLGVSTPLGTNAQSDVRLARSALGNFDKPGDAVSSQHFFASVRCQPDNCQLQLSSDDLLIGRWPIEALHPSTIFKNYGTEMHIESVTVHPSYQKILNTPTLRRYLMTLLARMVPILTEILVVPAILWFLTLCVFDIKARSFRPITALSTAVLLVIVPRIILLAVLDATSIPLERRYLTPALAPSLFFIALMTIDATFRLQERHLPFVRKPKPASG